MIEFLPSASEQLAKFLGQYAPVYFAGMFTGVLIAVFAIYRAATK